MYWTADVDLVNSGEASLHYSPDPWFPTARLHTEKVALIFAPKSTSCSVQFNTILLILSSKMCLAQTEANTLADRTRLG